MDNFGDRMKHYEGIQTKQTLIPLLPIIARMDGICFSNFTHDLSRPYDIGLSKLMIETAQCLIYHFNANAAYVQSDEITLGWLNNDYGKEMLYGGRIQKFTSHLASQTTVTFNHLLPEYLSSHAGLRPAFDARVFNVPNITEAANQFLWREQDATKNAISMAARAYFSHAELHNKSGSEMQEMLFSQKNINFNDYPNFFKRGTFIVRRMEMKPFTAEELKNMPPEHNAHKNPDLKVERNTYTTYTDLPKFSTVMNREGFLFLQEDPVYSK